MDGLLELNLRGREESLMFLILFLVFIYNVIKLFFEIVFVNGKEVVVLIFWFI